MFPPLSHSIVSALITIQPLSFVSCLHNIGRLVFKAIKLEGARQNAPHPLHRIGRLVSCAYKLPHHIPAHGTHFAFGPKPYYNTLRILPALIRLIPVDNGKSVPRIRERLTSASGKHYCHVETSRKR